MGRDEEELTIRNEALEFRPRRSMVKTEGKRLEANTGSCTTSPSAAASSGWLVCWLVHMSRQNFRLRIR